MHGLIHPKWANPGATRRQAIHAPDSVRSTRLPRGLASGPHSITVAGPPRNGSGEPPAWEPRYHYPPRTGKFVCTVSPQRILRAGSFERAALPHHPNRRFGCSTLRPLPTNREDTTATSWRRDWAPAPGPRCARSTTGPHALQGTEEIRPGPWSRRSSQRALSVLSLPSPRHRPMARAAASGGPAARAPTTVSGGNASRRSDTGVGAHVPPLLHGRPIRPDRPQQRARPVHRPTVEGAGPRRNRNRRYHVLKSYTRSELEMLTQVKYVASRVGCVRLDPEREPRLHGAYSECLAPVRHGKCV